MSSPSQVPTGPSPPPSGPTSGGGDGQSSSSGTSASNLYLVTFLATLFLLLFISCAIILRSYILRRRYQRGTDILLTPRIPGSRHTRFGHMPKLFDSWIANGGGKWNDMLPIAAQPVFVKKRRRDSVVLKSPGVGQPTSSTLEPPSSHPNHGVRSLLSRFRRDTTSSPNPSGDVGSRPHSQSYPSHSTSKNRVEMLQISVLIAMPSQIRTLRKNALADSSVPEDDEEPPLPHLVLGITKIPYHHNILDAKSTLQPPPSDIPNS